MVDLPNPFDPISERPRPSIGEPVSKFASHTPASDAAVQPFPRGFEPNKFLADVESPPTSTSDLGADEIGEDEIARIIEALGKLAVYDRTWCRSDHRARLQGND